MLISIVWIHFGASLVSVGLLASCWAWRKWTTMSLRNCVHHHCRNKSGTCGVWMRVLRLCQGRCISKIVLSSVSTVTRGEKTVHAAVLFVGSRRSQAPGSAKDEACKRAFAVSHDLSRGSATANSWSHELPSRSGLNFQWSMAKQTQIEGESEHCARVNCESRASPLRSFLSPPPTSLSPEGWSYR